MKRLTPACRLLLLSLWHKREYFVKRGHLADDGSFYYDDKRLSEETGLDEKTIMRAKRFLKECGFITIQNGITKGRATKYWILRKPDKKSPFVDISKPDNLSVKPDNLSLRATQNVAPNKEITNEINNSVNLFLAKDDEEGIRALAKLKGSAYAKKFFVNRGYKKEEIERILN